MLMNHDMTTKYGMRFVLDEDGPFPHLYCAMLRNHKYRLNKTKV